jgi:hypothetical protein
MDKNTLNSKFGKCCKCPALMDDDRLFRSYVSTRIYEDNNMKKLKLLDSHSYRNNLQNNGVKYMTLVNNEYENYKCTNNKKNSFYIDSSNYNFSTMLKNNYVTPNIDNNYIKKSLVSNF